VIVRRFVLIVSLTSVALISVFTPAASAGFVPYHTPGQVDSCVNAGAGPTIVHYPPAGLAPWPGSGLTTFNAGASSADWGGLVPDAPATTSYAGVENIFWASEIWWWDGSQWQAQSSAWYWTTSSGFVPSAWQRLDGQEQTAYINGPSGLLDAPHVPWNVGTGTYWLRDHIYWAPFSGSSFQGLNYFTNYTRSDCVAGARPTIPAQPSSTESTRSASLVTRQGVAAPPDDRTRRPRYDPDRLRLVRFGSSSTLRAGRRFAVGDVVMSADGHVVRRGPIRCKATIAGRRLPAKEKLHIRGWSVCVYRIPDDARGERIRGKITVFRQGWLYWQRWRGTRRIR
jgi:hypothetical protein